MKIDLGQFTQAEDRIVDSSFTAADSKYHGLAKMLIGSRMEINARWKEAGEAFAEQTAFRNAHLDEMEKLIGVRDLGQHPDGINGGVLALLGITTNLEASSRTRWDAFVIGELLRYTELFDTKELNERLQRQKEMLLQPIGFMARTFDTIEGIKEYVQKTVTAEWEKLKGNTLLTSTDFEKKLKSESEKLFYWTFGTTHTKITIEATFDVFEPEHKMRVVARINKNDAIHGHEFVL